MPNTEKIDKILSDIEKGIEPDVNSEEYIIALSYYTGYQRGRKVGRHLIFDEVFDTLRRLENEGS